MENGIMQHDYGVFCPFRKRAGQEEKMQAILLAGGLGTRLRSVVSDRPKPMALIENRPFMEYVVHELSRYCVTDIIFAVVYKGTMVE